MNWRTLRTCTAAEANLLTGYLEGFGVQPRVVDASGSEISRDHVSSHTSPLSVLVRDADRNVAIEILGDALAPLTRRRVGTPVERLGLSIRACAVSPFAPLGLVLAPTYLMRAAREGTRPREHASTLAGIAACVPTSLFYAFAFHGIFLS